MNKRNYFFFKIDCHFPTLYDYLILAHFPPYTFVRTYTFIRQVRVNLLKIGPGWEYPNSLLLQIIQY